MGDRTGGSARAVIVSGASRGLGAACVALALDRGARVLALAREFGVEQRARAEREPRRLKLRRTDLGALAEVPGAEELAEFLSGAADIVLINNAATIDPIGAVGRLGAAPIAAATALNLASPVQLTDALLAALQTRPSDALSPQTAAQPLLANTVRSVRIVFVTSSAARRPKPGTAVYCATKAGAEMFFAVLAEELAVDDRFTVDVVDPGGMATDMHASLRTRDGVYFPDQARMRDVAAAGRLGDPVEVARRILDEHLAADAP